MTDRHSCTYRRASLSIWLSVTESVKFIVITINCEASRLNSSYIEILHDVKQYVREFVGGCASEMVKMDRALSAMLEEYEIGAEQASKEDSTYVTCKPMER